MEKGGRKKPVVRNLPIMISLHDFNRLIKPCLSVGKRGPKQKLPLYRIFNYILYVLHTGIQWNQLPIRRNEIHWSNVYKWHYRWSHDGSYNNLFLNSVNLLNRAGLLDLTVLHGDGSNTVAKKGGKD
jgi:hypothetical protein